MYDSNNVFLRVEQGDLLVDVTVPVLFERLWEATAIPGNETDRKLPSVEGEQRKEYYIWNGTTGIIATRRQNTGSSSVERTLIVECEDKDSMWASMALSHNSSSGRYRIALPVNVELTGFRSGKDE